jgi:hypothetical protein
VSSSWLSRTLSHNVNEGIPLSFQLVRRLHAVTAQGSELGDQAHAPSRQHTLGRALPFPDRVNFILATCHLIIPSHTGCSR